MQESMHEIIYVIGLSLEFIGVISIVVGFVASTIMAIQKVELQAPPKQSLFISYRRHLAQSILIGLEFLVAGDIIRTVTGALTLEGVAVLAGIVAIRIVLGITLESEMRGEGWSLKKATHKHEP